jgi:hypothetical protein
MQPVAPCSIRRLLALPESRNETRQQPQNAV